MASLFEKVGDTSIHQSVVWYQSSAYPDMTSYCNFLPKDLPQHLSVPSAASFSFSFSVSPASFTSLILSLESKSLSFSSWPRWNSQPSFFLFPRPRLHCCLAIVTALLWSCVLYCKCLYSCFHPRLGAQFSSTLPPSSDSHEDSSSLPE